MEQYETMNGTAMNAQSHGNDPADAPSSESVSLSARNREYMERGREQMERGREQLERGREQWERGRERMEQARARSREEFDEMSTSLGRNMERLGDVVASTGNNMAGRLRRNGRYLQDSRPANMSEDLARVVREHPGATFCAGMTLGYALSRVLRPRPRRGRGSY